MSERRAIVIEFIKRLFCRHYKVEFVSNVYGDQINYFNCRSFWKCVKCGEYVKSQQLHISGEQE